MWLATPDFNKKLKIWWEEQKPTGAGYKFMEKLKGLKVCISTWNKEVFGNIMNQGHKILHQIPRLTSWLSREVFLYRKSMIELG